MKLSNVDCTMYSMKNLMVSVNFKCCSSITINYDTLSKRMVILNMYLSDDYNELVDVDGVFGNKADNNLKEYQSFTDLEFSKNKSIAHIDWHPSIKGTGYSF